MCKKVILVLFLLATALVVEAKNDEAKLMRLIEEEEKSLLAIPAKKRWPALYWQIMLLNMEKFRIVRNRENRTMLKESPETIARKGRNYYFRESLGYYKKIKKIGRLMVKRWPTFEHNDEIYYRLATMTIERNDQKEMAREVEYYLKKGLAVAKKGTNIYALLNVRLADHYYNFKKHKKAARYYLRAIKYKKDKWRTRSLFNLAWSLMSINKTKEAKKYIRDFLDTEFEVQEKWQICGLLRQCHRQLSFLY